MQAIVASLVALSEQLKAAPEFAKDPEYRSRLKFSRFKCKGKRDASLKTRSRRRKGAR